MCQDIVRVVLIEMFVKLHEYRCVQVFLGMFITMKRSMFGILQH